MSHILTIPHGQEALANTSTERMLLTLYPTNFLSHGKLGGGNDRWPHAPQKGDPHFPSPPIILDGALVHPHHLYIIEEKVHKQDLKGGKEKNAITALSPLLEMVVGDLPLWWAFSAAGTLAGME